MSAIVEKLVGKKLLFQTGAYDLNMYAELAEHMGMKIVSDGGHDETFATQFRQVKAAAGLLCVLYPVDADALLALPDNLHRKLVVLRTYQALDYPGMPEKYQLIENKRIEMVFEEWQTGWFDEFASTLVRAVYSK